MYQVMIVEDESSALEQLSDYVEEAGLNFHVVAKANGGEEALFYLEITQPDLIITDVKMPGKDGLTMLSEIKEIGWNGLAAIISGYDDFYYAQQALRLNVFDYLLKPVFPDDIFNLLQHTRELLNEKRKAAHQEDYIDLENGSEQANYNFDKLPSYLIKAKEFIQEHYAEPLTLPQVANAVSVTAAYLSSSFSKYCGVNFVEYLTCYRMNVAKRLLRNFDLQIQEVAWKVGYADVSYFNRVFRRKTGQTPRSYRNCLKV